MAATLLAQIVEDLAGKYNATWGFAESVTGPSGALLGIFSKEYLQADAGGFVSASSSTPTLRTRDADAMAKGDAVTIRSAAYVVVEVQPNGYGETLHRLQFAAVATGPGYGVSNFVMESSTGDDDDNLLLESGDVLLLEA